MNPQVSIDAIFSRCLSPTVVFKIKITQHKDCAMICNSTGSAVGEKNNHKAMIKKGGRGIPKTGGNKIN